MIKQLIAAGVFAGGLGLGLSAQADPLNLNLCGGSPNGLWQLLGVGMDGVLKADDPGSSVTYQTSSGGFANILQMQGDTCDLAIVHAGEAMKALSGEAPFPQKVDNFRAISVLYNWAPMQWVMTQDFADEYGIHSLQDIADKKPPLHLVLNRKGILTSMVGESSLATLGVTPEDIESWGGSVVHQGSAVATELVQNRRADMWANETFVGSSAISSMAENRPMTLLEVPDNVIKAMEKEYGDSSYTVPADAYTWLDQPIHTHTAAALLVVPASMPDDEAYRITKDLIDHLDVMQGVHPAMKQLTPQTLLAQSVVELHPGAKRAYEEAGLL